VFEEPTFIIGRGQPAHGAAERLEMTGKDHIRLTRGWFTTCRPGQEDWRFDAGEMELDYEAGVGRLKDGKLSFFDTPVLWLPFGSFPLENRRKSGLLAPYYSHNTRRGLELGVPFYWNIAPEVDLTLKPIYMSKRGEQIKSEFRYLDAAFAGNLRLEHMPEDKVLGISRSGFSYQHQHQITPNLLGWVDLNKVTDDRYFVDLASQVPRRVTRQPATLRVSCNTRARSRAARITRRRGSSASRPCRIRPRRSSRRITAHRSSTPASRAMKSAAGWTRKSRESTSASCTRR
jgi:LPS-assembly protein